MCVSLMTSRFMRRNLLKDIVYFSGIRSQPMMFVGGMYEKSASDLTIEMVLTANKN